MVQRYGLWAAIAGIFLLAIFGVRSAATWLSQTTPEPTAVSSNRSLNDRPLNDRPLNSELSEEDQGFDSQAGTRSTAQGAGQDSRQGDTVTNDSASSDGSSEDASSDGGSDELSQVTNTFSPLEEAGTYIQRQQSVERDPVVAASQVDVTTLASNTPTAAQSDSRVTQPAASDTQTAQPSPTAPTSQAVPALW